MTDRLEDFGPSQVGNKKAEYVARRLLPRLDIGAGAGTPRYQAESLQFIHGFGDGDARSKECLAQLRFAGQAVSGAVDARLNRIEEAVEDLPVLWQFDFRHVSAMPFSY